MRYKNTTFVFPSVLAHKMIQDIKAPITTYLAYDHSTNRVFPHMLKWEGKNYKVKNIGLHYTYRNGKTLYHAFAVTTDSLFFKLVLNTDNLFWAVEQISDGMPD